MPRTAKFSSLARQVEAGEATRRVLEASLEQAGERLPARAPPRRAAASTPFSPLSSAAASEPGLLSPLGERNSLLDEGGGSKRTPASVATRRRRGGSSAA